VSGGAAAPLLRVAFVGKGGVGKSAVSGTFARLLGRHTPVLAVDSDPMPGMAFSLGVPTAEAPIPDDAVVEKAEGEDGPRFRLRPGLTAGEAVERYAVPAPDGVRFLQFGKLRGPQWETIRSLSAFHRILDELGEDEWSLVGDLPGGTRQPFFGWGSYARTVLVVVEPTAKSLLSARRLARLAHGEKAPKRIVAVANKIREPGDADLVAQRTGLDVVGAIPYDDELADAERRGLAPLDAAPDCPAVRAVASLVERLREEQT
jgi:CO dehydrogenase maturation factor